MLAQPQSENAVDLALQHIHLECLCLDWYELSSVGQDVFSDGRGRQENRPGH